MATCPDCQGWKQHCCQHPLPKETRDNIIIASSPDQSFARKLPQCRPANLKSIDGGSTALNSQAPAPSAARGHRHMMRVNTLKLITQLRF